VDPKISMSEDFYLIAETDDLYNSSIGFVKEDSARFVSEKGSKSSTEAEIVIKNKYGHQLKKPFPYCSYEIAFIKAIFSEYVIIDATPVLFNVKRVLGSSDKITYRYEGTDLKLGIPFDFTYYVFSRYVTILNDNLKEYYREAPLPPQEKLDLVKPFLY